jgi:hypothetical protein
VTGGAIVVARAFEAVQLEATATSRTGLASRTKRTGFALLSALTGRRIARIGSAGNIDIHGAEALAIAFLGIHNTVAITGTARTENAHFVLAARSCTVAGSVFAAGGGRFGDTEVGIRRLHA